MSRDAERLAAARMALNMLVAWCDWDNSFDYPDAHNLESCREQLARVEERCEMYRQILRLVERWAPTLTDAEVDRLNTALNEEGL